LAGPDSNGGKHADRSIAEIGRELNVGTILEGSVRKAGDQVRVAAQLIDIDRPVRFGSTTGRYVCPAAEDAGPVPSVRFRPRDLTCKVLAARTLLWTPFPARVPA
jgi:hypothetical protein